MASRFPFFIAFFVLLASNQVMAQAYRFLNLPASPRLAALGGQPVSLPDASAAMAHANPAYLTSAHHRQFTSSIARQVGDISLGYASFAYDLPSLGTLSASVRYAGYGTLTQRDATGQALANFGAYDVAATLGYATTVGPALRYGITLNLIRSDYTHAASTAWSVSGGLLYALPEQQGTIGVALLNAGNQFSGFNGLREPLPFDVRAGYSRKLLYLPLRLSFTGNRLLDWDIPLAEHLELGGEFLFSDSFIFRIGYNHQAHEDLKTDNRIDLSGVGVGVGLRIKGVRIDMSRTSQSVVGPIHHLGTTIHF
jgi:hypothetical protein